MIEQGIYLYLFHMLDLETQVNNRTGKLHPVIDMERCSDKDRENSNSCARNSFLKTSTYTFYLLFYLYM